MNIREKIFRTDDIVFANILRHGRQLLSVKLTGVADIRQLVSYLRRRLDGIEGALVVKIRNYSQGWGMEQHMMMGHHTSTRRAAHCAPQGVQLTLF